MYVSFEIAALFSSPYRRMKKRGNFQTNKLVESIESILYCLSSRERLQKCFRFWVLNLDCRLV